MSLESELESLIRRIVAEELEKHLSRRTSDDPYLSVKEACNYLSTSESTIRRLLASGSLPYIKVGRTVKVQKSSLDNVGKQEVRTSVASELARLTNHQR